jgi:GAF domain-containing protein
MKRETSCITSLAIIDYIEQKTGGPVYSLVQNLDPEIDEYRDPLHHLKDPDNWISCKAMTRLFNRACRLLKDESTPAKIARHAIQNAALGYGQRIVFRAIGSHQAALARAQELNDRWNADKTIQVIRQSRHHAVIRIHWHPHVHVDRHVCEYNMGLYRYLPLLWDDPPLRIKERACTFSGSPYCEYRLRWHYKPRFFSFLSGFWSSRKLLMEVMDEMAADQRLLRRKHEELSRLNRRLTTKIRELTAVQETSKAILSILDLKQLLDVIMPLLVNACRIDRAAILLVHQKNRRLEYLHSIGYDDETPEDLRAWSVSSAYTRNIVARVASSGRSEYMPRVAAAGNLGDQKIFLKTVPASAFVVPLVIRSKVVGVLATDTIEEHNIPPETRETLEIFAPLIAIAIENARLHGRLNGQMLMLEKSRHLLGQAEKLSLLGNLAARLAHEIKNPLTAISTFIQLIPKKHDDPEFRNQFYEVAREETGRINALLSELLDLSRPREPSFAENDLHRLIEKTVLLISPQSESRRIHIERRYDPNADRAWMDLEK